MLAFTCTPLAAGSSPVWWRTASASCRPWWSGRLAPPSWTRWQVAGARGALHCTAAASTCPPQRALQRQTAHRCAPEELPRALPARPPVCLHPLQVGMHHYSLTWQRLPSMVIEPGAAITRRFREALCNGSDVLIARGLV